MRVLFLDEVHPILQNRLEEKGYECIDACKTPFDSLNPEFSKAEGIVVRSRFRLDDSIFDLCPKLKFIARSGSGLENIDLTAAKKRGIQVFNSPEGNANAVAEHALGMLLALFNNLISGDKQVRNGTWEREGNRGIELENHSVGIIGFGHTGSAFAQKLSGMSCEVLAYDKYKSGFGNAQVAESTMADIFEQCDILSFHVPLTDETRYLFNEKYITRFKKPFFLINTSRGKVVKIADLVQGMKAGKVRGACLDVLEYERSSFEKLDRNTFPDEFKYLTENNNVVLSPHVAGWTEESYVKLSSFLADKILDHFA